MGEPPNMNKRQKEALRGKFSDALMSTDMMVSTISEWYDAKHRKPSKEEVHFINSIVIEECPFCGSKKIRRDGFNKKTGLAIRECKTCGRKFNPLAGTIFDSRKIPFSEWIEFLVHLFQFHSVRTTAFDNRNAVTTGLYWLSKVFLVVDDIQSDIVFPERCGLTRHTFPDGSRNPPPKTASCSMDCREISSAYALQQTESDACCISAAWGSQAQQRH